MFQIAAAGMHPDVKRHSWRDSSEQFLELEKRVHCFVLRQEAATGLPASCNCVCQQAEKLAFEVSPSLPPSLPPTHPSSLSKASARIISLSLFLCHAYKHEAETVQKRVLF